MVNLNSCLLARLIKNPAILIILRKPGLHLLFLRRDQVRAEGSGPCVLFEGTTITESEPTGDLITQHPLMD